MENIERKPISGYEGLYDITSDGRVISLERHYVDSLGKSYFRSERYMSNYKDVYGYLIVSLTDRNGNKKQLKIHRLVAEAFIPYTGLNPDGTEIKGRIEVNHKSEIKTDNRVENLEWCDQLYNHNYGTRNERVAAKLRNNPKESKKVLCVETGVVYLSTGDVERKLGFKRSNISGCCNNKYKTRYGYHWKFVEEE